MRIYRNKDDIMNSNDASGFGSPISTPSSTNVTTDEIEEHFPQCNDLMKPKVNQTFITMDEAVKFYKDYATLCGFGTRLGTSKRAKGTVVDYTSRRVICSREGVREPTENKKMERVRPVTRVGCKAMELYSNGWYASLNSVEWSMGCHR